MASELIDTQNGIAWILASIGILRGDGQRPSKPWDLGPILLRFSYIEHNHAGGRAVQNPDWAYDPEDPAYAHVIENSYRGVFYPDETSMTNEYYKSDYDQYNIFHKGPQTFDYLHYSDMPPYYTKEDLATTATYNIDVENNNLVATVDWDYTDEWYRLADQRLVNFFVSLYVPPHTRRKIRVYRRIEIYSDYDLYSGHMKIVDPSYRTKARTRIFFSEFENYPYTEQTMFDDFKEPYSSSSYTKDNYIDYTSQIDDGMYDPNTCYNVGRRIENGKYIYATYESVDFDYHTDEYDLTPRFEIRRLFPVWQSFYDSQTGQSGTMLTPPTQMYKLSFRFEDITIP